MNESEQKPSLDTPHESTGQTESLHLPMVNFVLPLCLSFPTPFFFFALVVGTIATMTDPIRPQWIWSEFDWADWMDLIARVILLIGFVGMCRRKEWALWLTAIVQIIYTLWIWLVLGTSGFRKDCLVLFLASIYSLLIVGACFYVFWQCSRFKK